MRKSDVISYFGGKLKTAKALGISPASVTQWGEFVPESRAYQIEHITGKALTADHYRNKLKTA
ncbi:MAG: Cro/CI family transcriptional regulator [Vibrio sp.]